MINHTKEGVIVDSRVVSVSETGRLVVLVLTRECAGAGGIHLARFDMGRDCPLSGNAE